MSLEIVLFLFTVWGALRPCDGKVNFSHENVSVLGSATLTLSDSSFYRPE